MRNGKAIAFALMILVLVATSPGASEVANDGPAGHAPLAPFARLIGGRWHLGDSYQELEWGVGRRSVRARGFFIVDGEARLVSEGIWYWHPEERQIKGAFTAVDMPVAFFDYTTRFEEGRMVSDLIAYGDDGSGTVYVETWEFTDPTHFVWKLFRRTPDGLREEMGGTYEKVSLEFDEKSPD